MINLSLGALRDPQDLEFDGYSQIEHDAVEYAVARGVVVVAAVGNGTNAPKQPWDYADWPAALPHVLGVSALAENGSVPSFSDRDPVFVDVAAPGVGIFSTIPRNLVVPSDAGCNGEPYSNCGPAWLDDRRGDLVRGTAGHGRGRPAPRRRPEPDPGPGRLAARADSERRRPRDRMRRSAPPAATP